jgi:putative flippase GtrA
MALISLLGNVPMTDQMTGLFSPFLRSRRIAAVRPLLAQESVLDFRGASARFVVLSGISFSINLGLTSGLHELAKVKEEIAFAVALAVVLVTNFIGMRYFVYTGRQGNVIKQFVSFLLSSSGFRGLEYVLFLVLHTWLGLAYRLAIIATLATTFVTKFFFYGAVVFSRRSLYPAVSEVGGGPQTIAAVCGGIDI